MTDTQTAYLAHSNSRRSYHTDPECPHAPDDPIEKPLAVAERMSIDECGFCAGSYDPSPTTQFDRFPDLAASRVAPEVEHD